MADVAAVRIPTVHREDLLHPWPIRALRRLPKPIVRRLRLQRHPGDLLRLPTRALPRRRPWRNKKNVVDRHLLPTDLLVAAAVVVAFVIEVRLPWLIHDFPLPSQPIRIIWTEKNETVGIATKPNDVPWEVLVVAGDLVDTPIGVLVVEVEREAFAWMICRADPGVSWMIYPKDRGRPWMIQPQPPAPHVSMPC